MDLVVIIDGSESIIESDPYGDPLRNWNRVSFTCRQKRKGEGDRESFGVGKRVGEGRGNWRRKENRNFFHS